MFYIIQLIKHKSLTKDSGSLWTSALHGEYLFALTHSSISSHICNYLMHCLLLKHVRLPYIRDSCLDDFSFFNPTIREL